MGSYSFVGSGTPVGSSGAAALSPIAHASTAAGHLMLLVAANRAGAQTVAAISDWTQIAAYTTQGSLEIWARIADGTAADSPTVDWSGTAQVAAWIDTFSGDVYQTLSGIVAHSATEAASSAAVPLCPALTVTTNDCLIYAVGKKASTAGSVTAVSAPTGLTLAQSFIDNTFGIICGSAYLQQTTATSSGGDNFTLTETTPEATSSNGLIVALNTEVAVTPPSWQTTYRRPNVLLRM
jgi:hypothetical protein